MNVIGWILIQSGDSVRWAGAVARRWDGWHFQASIRDPLHWPGRRCLPSFPPHRWPLFRRGALPLFHPHRRPFVRRGGHPSLRPRGGPPIIRGENCCADDESYRQRSVRHSLTQAPAVWLVILGACCYLFPLLFLCLACCCLFCLLFFVWLI